MLKYPQSHGWRDLLVPPDDHPLSWQSWRCRRTIKGLQGALETSELRKFGAVKIWCIPNSKQSIGIEHIKCYNIKWIKCLSIDFSSVTGSSIHFHSHFPRRRIWFVWDTMVHALSILVWFQIPMKELYCQRLTGTMEVMPLFMVDVCVDVKETSSVYPVYSFKPPWQDFQAVDRRKQMEQTGRLLYFALCIYIDIYCS